MSSSKCKNCGGSEIDVDPARGDAVCTNCGSVLESSIIVSSVQFEDNAHGGSSAIGQFVSSDSKGGARGFGGAFHPALGVESREITLRNAKKRINDLAHQMRLNQHCADTAFNFFKMALSRNLTRGRRTGYVVAACVYMTCRTEGTAHMLIDFCDAMDSVGVYDVGRTYLRLSRALCINIPALDPCLYILRFANRLGFGEKTHEVSMTALRLVQRMKRDCIHTGRRPAGLCGAALLMAARLHEFNRTITDVIKIVKVHEGTLRKRLIEFGETPSSSLTLDEFMTVDLEEDQDPPSFKAARRKDHQERIQKALDEEQIRSDFFLLQSEIEKELDELSGKKRPRIIESKPCEEEKEAERFMEESTMKTIEECMAEGIEELEALDGDTGGDGDIGGPTIAPSLASLGIVTSAISVAPSAVGEVEPVPGTNADGVLTFDDLDDDELDEYIMTNDEVNEKDVLWNQINEKYLQDQKEKEEKLAREREEGKPEKKRKKYAPKRARTTPANTAKEAIEKMLQEKKISTKINYDVLKNLSLPSEMKREEPEGDLLTRLRAAHDVEVATLPVDARKKTAKKRIVKETPAKDTKREEKREQNGGTTEVIEEDQEDELVENEEPARTDEVSLRQLLDQHRDEDGEEEYYGGEEEDEY